jgi:hypothetical protein
MWRGPAPLAGAPPGGFNGLSSALRVAPGGMFSAPVAGASWGRGLDLAMVIFLPSCHSKYWLSVNVQQKCQCSCNLKRERWKLVKREDFGELPSLALQALIPWAQCVIEYAGASSETYA